MTSLIAAGSATGGFSVASIFTLLVVIVPLSVFVFSLVDMFKYSDASWLAARQNKALMLLLVLLVPLVGVLVYLVAARPVLRRAQAALSPTS